MKERLAAHFTVCHEIMLKSTIHGRGGRLFHKAVWVMIAFFWATPETAMGAWGYAGIDIAADKVCVLSHSMPLKGKSTGNWFTG